MLWLVDVRRCLPVGWCLPQAVCCSVCCALRAVRCLPLCSVACCVLLVRSLLVLVVVGGLLMAVGSWLPIVASLMVLGCLVLVVGWWFLVTD